MQASKQLWFPWQPNLQQRQIIIPAIAGCAMVCASILPWLKDPLGKVYLAWQLPIDIGWQFHTSILNYGLLCLCCAFHAFVVAYAHWKPFKGSNHFVHMRAAAGLFCLMPIILFLLQYLFIDVVAINQLARDEMQLLLVKQHFGYSFPLQMIKLDPFVLDVSVVWDRLELLINQMSFGLLLPLFSAWMLIGHRRLLRPAASKKNLKVAWLVGLLLLAVFGRVPAAMICESQAEALLAAGNYTQTLVWLNRAFVLNPALDQIASYHIERGEALYFLYPGQQSDDSRAYLAFTYRNQGDYLDAYQQLLAVWQSHHTAPWVVDEMSITLERLAEFTKPLNGPPIQRQDNDDTALSWLQLLTQIDPNNAYGHYVAGLIQYDIHNYTVCRAQMDMVIQLSHNSDIRSSAYTYIALSDAGQGDYVDERAMLFKAVELDPNYHNNTAREELSGLR